MKKNIFNAANAAEIIARVKKLSPTAEGRWGSLDVNTMLFHCNKVNNSVLEGKPTDKSPTLKQRIIKTIALTVLPKFPKGVKTDKRFVQTDNYDLEFEKERNLFIQTVTAFSNNKKPLAAAHPFFGKLSTQEWGRFAWMHLDHHLRQFGV